MRHLLFTFLQRHPGSTASVTRVGTSWRVELQLVSPALRAGAGGPHLDDTIKGALMGVEFAPIEADCTCGDEPCDDPCPFHTWPSTEE